MAGEWIPEKARGIYARFFPGEWEDGGNDVLQGRCPAEHRHGHGSARTDARVYLSYGPNGQSPGCYCLHNSCKGELDSLNDAFRTALFDRSGMPPREGQRPPEEGVVKRAPRPRESWIPEFEFQRLAQVVAGVEEVTPEWFISRSPRDPRRMTSGDFLEAVFQPGERVLVFTNFYSQGDYLWQVGKGGFRLADQRGVAAVRSKLPVDGGKDGIWYLCNPVTGLWEPNPRREGRYSRRSEESVTAWRHLVLECDEAKTLRKRAGAILEAVAAPDSEAREMLKKAGPEKWVADVMQAPRESWKLLARRLDEQAAAVPGLWFRFLAMAPLAIVAIYSSGGDSWHALIRVDQATKPDFDSLLRNYVKNTLPRIGADPGALTPVRLTRLPGCLRKGREQRLIYLNPAASLTRSPQAIRDLPRLRNGGEG